MVRPSHNKALLAVALSGPNAFHAATPASHLDCSNNSPTGLPWRGLAAAFGSHWCPQSLEDTEELVPCSPGILLLHFCSSLSTQTGSQLFQEPCTSLQHLWITSHSLTNLTFCPSSPLGWDLPVCVSHRPQALHFFFFKKTLWFLTF